jgi:adenine-specific DNA-methyltransferase
MPSRPKRSTSKKIPKAKETHIGPEAKAYQHPTAESPARPAAGVQARFKQKRAPKNYAYDSSLAPELTWDAGNAAARDRGESLIAEIRNAASLEAAKTAATQLKGMSKPFLNWAGKKERLSFDVPTLPLFIHERLSTNAVLDSVRDKQTNRQVDFLNLFGDLRHSLADQVLRAYEHQDPWTNRMILGDSLVVMNSLLEYEGLGGKVQMIYIDPPYGVKYNSNFQPFVGRRDVSQTDDADLTREPEMVQAYRDTWELGLHSYLSYIRDRLLLARELLTPSGSVFVQISDENMHHVREVMDEVFGPENFVSQVVFLKTSGFETSTIATLNDNLLWYARAHQSLRARKVYAKQHPVIGEGNATWLTLPDGSYRGVTKKEARGETPLPSGAVLYKPDNIVSQGAASDPQPFAFGGKTYSPPAGSHWKANYPVGMDRLAAAGRIHAARNSIQYRRLSTDFAFEQIGNVWTDTRTGNFTEDKLYVVQTSTKVIERCIHLTTDPGDLVLDPTCGSGTAAYVAEKWGRRWITIDTSRVPLALARQRLLTATFDWYRLTDERRGPVGGFEYKRKQDERGTEVGGIVPHLTLGSIANAEPPEETVLVNRPEIEKEIVRISGPFSVEATIPTPTDFGPDSSDDFIPRGDHADWVERVVTILRRSPRLHLGGTRTIELAQIRPPARSLALSAEAMVQDKPVAIVIGPEHGSVGERQVSEAGRESYHKGYSQLLVIGLAIEPNARALVENGETVMGLPATYVQATPDLLMGDLLKTMRTSQIFSVCGLPDITVNPARPKSPDDAPRWQVTLDGLDVFDPVSMKAEARRGEDVPCWMLDQDYDGMVFRAAQVFFPRTHAWDALKHALKADFDPDVWDHLSGTSSAPFSAPAGKSGFTVAVKVIDPRGNELLVTREVAQ